MTGRSRLLRVVETAERLPPALQPPFWGALLGLAVTAALTGALSARFSVDVRYDTDPPVGFEQTDTATRVSLVYAFGN